MDPERPNLVARLRGRGVAPPLLLLAHADIVPVEPADWSVDPLVGELRDGRVWGRGAVDMKGQVAAEVAAAVKPGPCWLAAGGGRSRLLVVTTVDEDARRRRRAPSGSERRAADKVRGRPARQRGRRSR